MGAVPEIELVEPAAVRDASLVAGPVGHRRFVAVTVTSMELLRPESDLARLMGGAARVDLLLACDDVPRDDDMDDEEEPDDDVGRRVAALELPELHLHRLALRAPLGAPAEGDLVAALSELVGFDPEPGVYCLAPAALPPDPSRAVVDRAVRRIARVYGIPLLRYRCLELSVVGPA